MEQKEDRLRNHRSAILTSQLSFSLLIYKKGNWGRRSRVLSETPFFSNTLSQGFPMCVPQLSGISISITWELVLNVSGCTPEPDPLSQSHPPAQDGAPRFAHLCSTELSLGNPVPPEPPLYPSQSMWRHGKNCSRNGHRVLCTPPGVPFTEQTPYICTVLDNFLEDSSEVS